MKLENVERVILESGNIMPSVIMEAMKADLKDAIMTSINTLNVFGKLGRTVWLAVDGNGDIWLISSRPVIDLVFEQYTVDYPGVSLAMFNLRELVTEELFYQLRLGIYYTEYLLEIDVTEEYAL